MSTYLIVIHNGFANVSGQLPRINDELICKGKLGKEVSIEEGQKASIICILNSLAKVGGMLELLLMRMNCLVVHQ
jgi:hypothetical protein